jgi:hypothetical protein
MHFRPIAAEQHCFCLALNGFKNNFHARSTQENLKSKHERNDSIHETEIMSLLKMNIRKPSRASLTIKFRLVREQNIASENLQKF